MKNVKRIAFLIMGILLQRTLMADLLHIRIKLANVTCTGGGNICNATVNAVGDLVTFDVKGQPISEIVLPSSGEKVITLALPAKPKEVKVYRIKPLQGELAGQELLLLIQNQLQRAGSRQENKTIFKLSRQRQGDAPTQWTDIGDLVTDKTDTLEDISVIATPDGTLVSFDTKEAQVPVTIDTQKSLPQGVNRVEFRVGKKDLTKKG